MFDITLKVAVDDVLNSHFMSGDNTLNLGYFEETILELVDAERLAETHEPVGLYVWGKVGMFVRNEIGNFFPWKRENDMYEIVCFANEWICEKSPMIMSDICRRIQRKVITYQMMDKSFKDKCSFAKGVMAIADSVEYCRNIVIDKKCDLEIYIDDIIEDTLKFYPRLCQIVDIDDVKEWIGKSMMAEIIGNLERKRKEFLGE